MPTLLDIYPPVLASTLTRETGHVFKVLANDETHYRVASAHVKVDVYHQDGDVIVTTDGHREVNPVESNDVAELVNFLKR